jgi:hypothetical protein
MSHFGWGERVVVDINLYQKKKKNLMFFIKLFAKLLLRWQSNEY